MRKFSNDQLSDSDDASIYHKDTEQEAEVIIQTIENREVDPLNEISNNSTPLLKAILDNNITVVEQLLMQGAIIDKGNVYRLTPLIYSVLTNNIDIMKLLLKHSANPNLEDIWGKSALNYAISRDNIDMIRLLLKEMNTSCKFDSNKSFKYLYEAIEKNSKNTVQLLIDFGADVNAKNETGFTALMFAAKKKQTKIVKLLLKHNADPHCKDMRGSCALTFAIREGVQAGVSIYYASLAIVGLLLEYKVDPNTQDEGEGTALINAVRYGHWDIAELLLKSGATIPTYKPLPPEKYSFIFRQFETYITKDLDPLFRNLWRPDWYLTQEEIRLLTAHKEIMDGKIVQEDSSNESKGWCILQ